MKNEVFSHGQKMANWDHSAWEFAVASHARWSTLSTSLSDATRHYAQTRVADLESKYPQLKKKETK